jgi:hypothetical protein
MGAAARRAPLWAWAALALSGVALLGLDPPPTAAEQTQGRGVVVSLDGGVAPRKLPRTAAAPVRIRLSGSLRTLDRAPLPRLRRIELALTGGGVLDTRGLAACPRARLAAAEPATALAACGRALVGHGSLAVKVHLPGQRPFDFHASLRAFNGRLPGGGRAVWLHVHGADPPSSFVLPFAVRRRPGDFATALVATVPPDLGPWPHLARFEMTLGRRYAWRGERHSYLSASCPLPPRFTAGVFPFARATYAFAQGHTLATEIVRGCRVRGPRVARG